MIETTAPATENRSLIALAHESANLEEMIIQSNGELTPEIEAALAITGELLPPKVDNYALMIERMGMLKDFYKAKADFYSKLAKSATGVADRLKANLRYAMDTLQTREIAGLDVKFKLVANNPSCIIYDEAKVPEAYKAYETIMTIDKKRIIEDLKLGVPVTGAHLEIGTSIRQYANSPGSKSIKSRKEVSV